MHGMTLLSFRLFRKNLGNLREFFGQMVHRPPGKRIARTPMRKVIWDCISFALLRSVIGLKYSCHPLNQSDAKLKPIASLSLAFSPASGRLHVFTLSSELLRMI